MSKSFFRIRFRGQKYAATPLGLAAMIGIAVIVIALIVLLVSNFTGSDDPQNNNLANNSINSAAVTDPTAKPAASATAQPVPTVKPTATPAPRSATIRALGEIAIETDLLKSAIDLSDNSFDFSPMFSEVADIMGDADYTIANVEGTMGDTLGISGSGSKMHTPSAILAALKSAGVDMMMLANDHALDGTFSEQQATVQNVANAGLDYVGAARSAEERSTPVIKNINGIKVGFVAYAESMNGNENAADPNALAYGVNLVARSNAAADIQRTRDAGADVIVALVSWGNMFSRSATETQQQIAMALTMTGVDVIIGYGPHTVQPALWLEAPAADGSGTNRTLCLCATGNFLSDPRAQYFDSGIVFEFTVQEKADGSFEITAPRYIPTYVLRYENAEKGVYEYRTLAAGRWTDDDADNMLEGMAYADLQRMAQVWSEMQSTLGSSVASIARE